MTRKSRRELENALADLDEDGDEDDEVGETVLIIDWLDDYPSVEDIDREPDVVVDFTNVDT